MELRHFKVDPVLKIDETVYKQAESIVANIDDVLMILYDLSVK